MVAPDPDSPLTPWKELLDEPDKAVESMVGDRDALARFLARAREFASAHGELEAEYEELQLLHEVTLEHSTDIEEQLAQKIDEVQALVRDLEVRNSFIREVFGRYMTDEVVHTLLESPDNLKLGGEKRTITILMSDLRGFSSLCERLSPEQVVRTLNTYLAAMADIISAYQGTINEFIGDAILAVFGAPISREDDAERAIACALSMQHAMLAVNRTLSEAALPPLEMGIGVHTGEVVVGNIGSLKRAKYGLVGSPVNLTSRIESYTVGGQVLVSDHASAHLRDRLEIGESFMVAPKGINEPLTIHEVLAIHGRHEAVLPARDIELHGLTPPHPVVLAIVDGKDVGTERYPARMVSLGPDAAQIEAETAPELGARTNVKLRFGPASDENADEVYAKVMRTRKSGAIELRFTSVPPNARAWIHAQLQLAHLTQ